MNEEIFFLRQWAETVRLYSGLLEESEREKFIKQIAEKDVLLAAECQATSFYDYSKLDEYLEQIALNQAKDFKNAKLSANGVLALAELNKFDSITEIFATIKDDDIGYLHGAVVNIYVANGNETQIATLLVVLAKTNVQLFQKAIDKAFEMEIYFSPQSMVQAEVIFGLFQEQTNLLLLAKAICVFRSKYSAVDPYRIFEILMEKKQIKYAERILKLYSINPPDNLFEYFDQYILKNESLDTILRFLNLCQKYNIKHDLQSTLVKLSTHLNPQVKHLIFSYQQKFTIEKDLAHRIAISNLKIATKASIEFAFEIIEKYSLENQINIETIIDTLLENPKLQRIEIAYKAIIAHELTEKYSISHIIDILFNMQEIQAFSLALQIIKENFTNLPKVKLIQNLLAITIGNPKYNRFVKDLVFNELYEHITDGSLKVNRRYIGFVLKKFKGFYQIMISSDNLFVSVPEVEVGFLKSNRYIELKLLSIDSENIKQSKIKITDLNPFSIFKHQFTYENLFIGEILILKVDKYDNYNVYLKPEYITNLRFVVNIREIAHTYVKSIGDFVTAGQQVKVKVVGFDKNRQVINCSLKAFQKKEIKRNDKLTDQEVLEKIKLLQEVFSTKTK